VDFYSVLSVLSKPIFSANLFAACSAVSPSSTGALPATYHVSPSRESVFVPSTFTYSSPYGVVSVVCFTGKYFTLQIKNSLLLY
jgi:hypothetical protein